MLATYNNHPLIQGKQVRIAFWRSDEQGRPVNGGKGDSVHAGLVQTVPGPLQICTHRALHGSLAPGKWRGDRWWVVALVEPVQEQDSKLASLTRIILEELC